MNEEGIALLREATDGIAMLPRSLGYDQTLLPKLYTYLSQHAPATITVNGVEVPELPQPALIHCNEPREFFTADQMRQYAVKMGEALAAGDAK